MYNTVWYGVKDSVLYDSKVRYKGYAVSGDRTGQDRIGEKYQAMGRYL